MITGKILRHILIPSAAVVTEKAKSSSSGDRVCKASELPIYATETPKPQKQEICTPREPGAIEQTISTVRKSLFSFVNEAKAVEQLAEDYLHQGWESAESLVEYLQEEENTTSKYGAVAVGGLAGLILGLRGGIFKKFFYTSAGALGMAAVCYPKEATEYSQIALVEAQKYATIAYNFIYGEETLRAIAAIPVAHV